MPVATEWKHLEARPEKRTKQLYVKGRNMKVWHLVAPVLAGHCTAEEQAADYRLDVEVVREAIAYFHENEHAILAEVEEDDRLLATGLDGE